MFRNYLKIAFRNLWKYRSFSVINIAGLAIGMAACLFILQYVSFKLSYDQFHDNANNIYRVVNDRYQQGVLKQHGTITYSGVGKAMNDDYEEVVSNARVLPGGEVIVRYNDKLISEDTILIADNAFLQMFSFPVIAGDKKSALREPYTVMLSESFAKKLFDIKGNDYSNAVGNSIKLMTDTFSYRIDGIYRDIPENSHLRFNMLISYPSIISQGWKEAEYDFTWSDFWHYVTLKPGTDLEAFNAKMPAFSQKHFQGNKISGSDETFYLQPLSKAHLYSDFEYEIGLTGSATVVWGLLIIALFIICIAWVNYINLATARSVERAKEVGIRKVVGGLRKQLIAQFLTESLLINLLGISLAVLLVLLLQPAFNKLLQHQLSLSYLFTKGLNGYNILILLSTIIIAGILVSGFYPAFVLSSFKPIVVLKGKHSNSKSGILFRKALVITQFCVTVALIIGCMVVLEQLRYMNKKDLGFNMDQVLVVNPPLLAADDSVFLNKIQSFKESLKNISNVKGATTSWRSAGDELPRAFNVQSGDSASTKLTIRNMGIDYDFINIYGIKLIAGRNLRESDHNASYDALRYILINESAVKLFGYKSPKDAIGKVITRNRKEWEICGVIGDYHQKSLRHPMEPTFYMPMYSNNSPISVKINTSDISGSIAAIKKEYESFFPGNLFEYYFLDERFNLQYKNEQIFGKVFGIFAGLAIFVACLGLFGLAMFSAIQRTKEIGVRKVLGATVPNILVLISRDFIKLVLISIVAAIPIAWWVMSRWLEGFTYRIEISWWFFAIAGLMAILVALFTVSFQAVKAAVANPVKSLRTE